MNKRQPCYCESNLCDHDDEPHGRCKRPADDRLVMAYVGHTCIECAGNMIATGGGSYIGLSFDPTVSDEK